MEKHETHAKYNIAETCAASISISDLLALSERPETPSPIPTSTKLTYGSIRGSDALRNILAALYSARASTPLSKDNILITPGAIAANFLVFYTLLARGDHVICHYPTYSQLYQGPRSLGAEVSLWKTSPAENWQLEASALRGLIKANTKLLILNNPNNPTGTIIPRSSLEAIISIAREHNIVVLCDEVYRPLFHSLSPSDPAFPPSALNSCPATTSSNSSSSYYENTIVSGSLSKAYSLAGLRLGWLATRSPTLLDQLAHSRHYTAISVSQLDEAVAAQALSDHTIHALLARNIKLAKTNLALLEAFVQAHAGRCTWVKPVAGTTAFVRFAAKTGQPVDDAVLAERLVQEKGVLVVPGGVCFEDQWGQPRDGSADGGNDSNANDEVRGAERAGEGEVGAEPSNAANTANPANPAKAEKGRTAGEFAGYLRIGFVNETGIVQAALDAWIDFMREGFEDVPVLREEGRAE
jgi:aspartate/methionine/tyrosine aminotransferase